MREHFKKRKKGGHKSMTDYLKSLLGENYVEGMSIEDISNALEQAGIGNVDEHNDTENAKLKNLISKRNAEIAKYKNELKAKLSESEAKELERNNQLEEMQEELNTLKAEKQQTEYIAKFASQGYDSENAMNAAKAVMANDIDTLLKIQSSVFEKRETELKSQLMKNTPRPSGATNATEAPETMTKEKLKNMSLKDRIKYSEEHPEEYKQLYSTN